MTVSPVSATQQASATSGTAGSGSTTAGPQMDYNSFLKLLVAEMSNQDPLNPTDSTQYVAQFATFSSVEQSIKTNAKLDSMMAVSALTQANSLIGRTVVAADGSNGGVVAGVKAGSSGIEAVLKNGDTVTLGSGTEVY
ncbi:flagellar hook assembly protein FlgD [Jiella sp. MQZ9-1]|uniref:Basal-body rod modification protein FlgD n=1 Tax=Jiella flava TaxID=2816857 RepID=A0A939FSR9_9HYPH|nr:flagellar hook assembly protein FlgD [Jiella flava]MBO0661238.1 flagellar hook assembly protein FlgD [Jiella flava]MCD2469883.1 flagellar hook assembly protein FlgD [Jiella flava]